MGDQTRRLLFDLGFSEFGAAFNADNLKVDLTTVEAIAISHGHPDHTGGFKQLVQKTDRKGIPLVIHPSAFRYPRYRKTNKGFKRFSPAFSREMIREASLDLVETEKPYPLLDKTILFLGQIPRETTYEKGMPNAYYREKGQEKFDAIEDDTAIVMNLKSKGLVILSGCAHSGIINTVNYARMVTDIDQVYAVMGGFHLTGSHFEPFIEPTTQALKAINPVYVIPTHCTGRKAINYMEKELPDKFILNMAGTKLTFI
ncbi:MAG: MBL fold metallo-hydrolase [Thermodesulfobacteriota bacterium]|jgi:7,8-dihydropterin-6-yl-methyl-4-(beta-D-ribofuranosyl)aminobenzene 5'-phosphate synthase